MYRIAVLNQKGGVGKTTTAVNLAAALADRGRRVGLIDLDPQAHATLHFGVTPSESSGSLYNVLVGNTPLADVQCPVGERLWVAPAHLDLAAAEVELAGVVGRELILKDRLAECQLEVDYLLVDCPPSLGVLTLNALAAVDRVYIPLQPHFLALHGLSQLLETIGIVARRLNDRLRVDGVVFCMYESGTRLAAEVIDDVEEFFRQAGSTSPILTDATIFRTRIRRNIRLAEAPSFGRAIFDYAPNSNGAKDYRELAEEVIASTENDPVAAPAQRWANAPAPVS